MLEVEGLGIRFDDHWAVREASLSIQPGRRIGLVGESGCGKSITALSLMGMAPDQAVVSGSIRLGGAEMVGARERDWRRHRAHDVAMIFQEPMTALNPLMRVGEIIGEPLRRLKGFDGHRAREQAMLLLEEVGMPDPEARLKQYPHQLSGGQRQRVLIAAALSCDPALLIADEPVTALDVRIAADIINLLLRLSRERQMALLFISHDLDAVARATTELVVMYGGDMVERGPTREVLEAPVHPYTRGLMAARPQIDFTRPHGTRLPSIVGSVPGLADLAPGCRFSGRCPIERGMCAGNRPDPTIVSEGRRALCHAVAEEVS